MSPANNAPVDENIPQTATEDMPLLGRVGDATQREGKPLYANLFLGRLELSSFFS